MSADAADPYAYHDDELRERVDGADEEAQLLPAEEFELEDDGVAPPTPPPSQWAFLNWLAGPRPPQAQRIKPIFPTVQTAPTNGFKRLVTEPYRRIVLVVFLASWAVAFALPLRAALPIRDADGQYFVNLDCVDTLWRPRNGCGLDGLDCGPFSNSSFSFRCPANCLGVRVLNPHAVGPLEVNYRPLVVGGSVYRGDSFICGSAIHAGVVSAAEGGCGRISLQGRHESFPASARNGIESIGFDSYFPQSFSVVREDQGQSACAGDPRRAVLLVSLFFTVTFSIFAAAPWQFFIAFIAIFSHVSFVSDPPGASYHNISVLPDHISAFAERILPALFCAVVIYRTSVRRVLSDLDAPFEKTLLWLGGFWFGALSNYTFDWIPINRLSAHDLEQQPGAKVALAIILLVLVSIVVQQMYYFRLEGRLLRYLGLYGLFIAGILLCLAVPAVELRIHHYILALLLLPGTSIQTRPSLLYQGILLGLFVNGAARWGFASVLQTAGALRGDGAFGSLIPNVTVVSSHSDAITFTWAVPTRGLDGISVLVNDVERFRRFFVDAGPDNFTWPRPAGMNLPEYFRFAFMKDGVTLDYSKAGTWFGNGSWSAIPHR